jgi:hypothetical protein
VVAAGREDPQGVAARLRVNIPEENDVVTFDGEVVTYDGEVVTFGAVPSAGVDSLLSDAEAAVLLVTNFGSWRVAGVSSFVEQVVGLGYVMDVTMELLNPRYLSSTDVLRLIDGQVWEVR